MQIPNIKASNKIKNQIKIMKTSAHLRPVSGLWGKEGRKLLSGFWAIRFWASTTNTAVHPMFWQQVPQRYINDVKFASGITLVFTL